MEVGKVSKIQSFKRLLIKFAAKSFLAFIGVQGFVYEVIDEIGGVVND